MFERTQALLASEFLLKMNLISEKGLSSANITKC